PGRRLDVLGPQIRRIDPPADGGDGPRGTGQEDQDQQGTHRGLDAVLTAPQWVAVEPGTPPGAIQGRLQPRLHLAPPRPRPPTSSTVGSGRRRAQGQRVLQPGTFGPDVAGPPTPTLEGKVHERGEMNAMEPVVVGTDGSWQA